MITPSERHIKDIHKLLIYKVPKHAIREIIVRWEEMRPGQMLFPQKKKLTEGCGVCQCNNMGVCILTNKEISYIYTLQARGPAWCPLKERS